MSSWFSFWFSKRFFPLASSGRPPRTDASLQFKWADNYIEGDLYSFYTRGDAAPYGRLNRVYTGNNALNLQPVRLFLNF